MMSEIEILQKAIEKAVKNGFKHEQMTIDDPEWLANQLLDTWNESFLIFNHDFAKAFWGDRFIREIGIGIGNPAWRYHLQQMVLEEEPLKYLRKFL